MSNQIVTENVSQVVAAAPSTLQSTGAMISQGGTNTTPGTKTLLTQPSDLTPILAATKALTSLTWSANVVTATTTVPHGWTNGDVVLATVAGALPAPYNGTFSITVTGASTFTYPLVGNPGSSPASPSGTVILADKAEILAMATSFVAQGKTQAVYVLELGEGTAAEGVTALAAYITANPATFYSYLVPAEWAAEATYLTFLANFESTTSKTYFFTTASTGNYTGYTTDMKCAVVFVPAPDAPATEFGCAALFYVALNYKPSSTNRVTPYAFSFLFGVTAWPEANNQTTLASLKAAFVNYAASGAEGGISNVILKWGTTKDGRQFTYWYSVDWVQINVQLAIANEVINGSNNPLAPLYYDQPGINRLQARAQATVNAGISFGLVVGPAPVTAVPFAAYIAANPSGYQAGAYNGLAVEYSPTKGFLAIVFDIVVSDLPIAA